jgi:hypothetical protein
VSSGMGNKSGRHPAPILGVGSCGSNAAETRRDYEGHPATANFLFSIIGKAQQRDQSKALVPPKLVS